MNLITSSVFHRSVCSLLARNKTCHKFGRVFMSEMQNQKNVPKGSLNPDLTQLKVDRFQKLLLVWGGKYKKIADVPELVNQNVLEKARNRARVKINIMMGVATLFGCLIMVYSGKKAAERGESISKINAELKKELIENLKK